MRAIKLLVFGALGALGLLRGIELLLVVGLNSRAILPLALGVLFLALFAWEWKKPAKAQPGS